MKEQNIGLGDLVRSDKDAMQGIVKGGSLDGSHLALDTKIADGYGEGWPMVQREHCELVEKGYAQKLHGLWH